MHLAIRASLTLTWLIWCISRLGPTPPVVSPEGIVTLAGRVVSITCDDVDRCQLTLEPALADGHPIPGPVYLITDSDPELTTHPGDVVAISAFVRAERMDTNPGVTAPWSAPRARWRAWAQPTAALGVSVGAADWRLSSEPLLTLKPLAEALYRALLLGDRRGLSLSVRAAFADTGTAHLLAISGLHLAVVGWGLFRVLVWLLACVRWFGQTHRVAAYAATLATALTWTYVLGIDASPATLRAAILLTLVFVGGILARRVGAVRALLLTAGFLITWEPRIALGASFQLSFAAVSALVAIRTPLRRLRDWLEEPGRLQGSLWRWAARWTLLGGVVSLATTVATAPLTLAWFGQFSPWGVVINLVAVPFASLVVVPVGFVWYLLATLWPALAEPLAWLPDTAGTLLVEVVQAIAHYVGPSHVPAWPHMAGILGAVAVVCGLAGGRGRIVGLVLVGWLLVTLSWSSPGGVTLTALDVGHGDAMVVESPDGRVALVDTGGRRGDRGNAYLAARTLIPALARLGHARLDALVLTHADLDHLGAAAHLVSRLEVDEVWVPPCAIGEPSVARLLRPVLAAGGRLRVLSAEDLVRWGALTWDVLWPPRSLACEEGTNESGLVMALGFAGRRLLLTADVGLPTEQRLLSGSFALGADILKVGHHGSRGSSSPAFISAVDPDWALVSGRYVGGRMPPHQDVLRRLCTRGVAVSITGRDGAVQARISEGGEIVVERLRPP